MSDYKPKIVEIDYTLTNGKDRYHVICIAELNDRNFGAVRKVIKEFQNDPKWINPGIGPGWINNDFDPSGYEEEYPEYFI